MVVDVDVDAMVVAWGDGFLDVLNLGLLVVGLGDKVVINGETGLLLTAGLLLELKLVGLAVVAAACFLFLFIHSRMQMGCSVVWISLLPGITRLVMGSMGPPLTGKAK